MNIKNKKNIEDKYTFAENLALIKVLRELRKMEAELILAWLRGKRKRMVTTTILSSNY